MIRKPQGQRFLQSHGEPFLQSANYPPSSQDFSDYGAHESPEFQDYVDKMQYRHEGGSRNVAHEGARLGVLPKMVADQIDYDRISEKSNYNQRPAMISGSQGDPDFEDYGDLSMMQNAYEDEWLADELFGKSFTLLKHFVQFFWE